TVRRERTSSDFKCGTAAIACSAKPIESMPCSTSLLFLWCSSGGVGRAVPFLFFSSNACFHHKNETTAFCSRARRVYRPPILAFSFYKYPFFSKHRTDTGHPHVLRATMHVSFLSLSPLIPLYLCPPHLYVSFTLLL
ncbi:unnamed protein product, partial [Ectocarpus sp. 4 AP-2014]